MPASRALLVGVAELLESATNEIVVVVDRDDVVQHWSKRAEAEFRTPSRKAKGQQAADLLPLPRRALDGGSPFERLRRGESWAAAPDPTTEGEHYTWLATPILDGAKFQGAIYRARRITREAADARVETRSSLAEQAFEHALENLAVIDRERRVVVANAAFRGAAERALGAPLKNDVDALALSAPGAELGFLDGLAQARAGQRVRRHRMVRFPNGEEFSHHVEYTPLPDSPGAILFGSVLVDVERQAAVARELLENSLDHAPFSLLIAHAGSPDLPLIYASRSVERITGYAPEELVGQNARVLQGRHRDQPALAIVRRAIATATTCSVVLKNQRKDGSTFWNRMTLAPVRDADGAVTHFVAIQEDVSESEDLRRRIQLAQAAETSLAMASGTAHDLRNMLTVIGIQLGFIAADASDRPEVAESLVEAREALEKATSLTRAMLSPIPKENGLVQTFAAVDLIRTVTTIAKYVLPPHVELEVVMPPPDLRAIGDVGALEQVVLNLVLNARDAMPDSGGVVKLSALEGLPAGLTPEPKTAPAVTIVVEDTGTGMSPATVARIFEPFFTTKERGGTGLGLATSHTIVKGLGGSMHVTSTLGKGSTFFVVLPQSSVATARLSSRPPPRTLVGVELLIVEPDTGVRANLAAVLRRCGARVDVAGDRAVAQRKMARQSKTGVLLLVDAKQPMTSELLAHWFEGGRDRRAVVLGEPDGRLDARTSFIADPYDVEDLIRALQDRQAAPRST